MPNERTRILVVDDEEIVRESLAGWLEKDGYLVATASGGAAALARLQAEPWSILIVDLKMPGVDGLQVLEQARRLVPDLAAVMMTAHATVDTAVAAMKLGAYDYLVKPFDPEELSLMVQKIAAQQSLLRQNAVLRQALKQEHRFQDLVSKSPAMQAVFELARSAARSSAPVLVVGEPGSGREVLARAIHQESGRAGAPFVAVSCAALPGELLAAELFGFEEGPTPGAAGGQAGKLEAARGGTLFLGEVGEASPRVQLELLRLLEERSYRRLGGTTPVEVDLRIMAAARDDLRQAVQEGRYREDLLRRLAAIPVAIPPLRSRREDLPPLVDAILERLAAELERPLTGVSPEAMAALMEHGWPGNVRELRNVLERGARVSAGPVLQVQDLGLGAPGGAGAPGPLPSLEEVERRHVSAVLSHTGGNVSQSARILGIDRVTLYNKMRRWNLRRDGGPGPARGQG